MRLTEKKRVLILGGGFGGIYTALELEKSVGKKSNIEITLVNKENFFLFTPMLHEVAASDLDMTHIVNPIRKLLRHVKFFEGNVEKIDVDKKQVTVSHASERHTHIIEYDYLVIALGCITNFFNMKELEERAFTMKTLGDAIHLRNHMIEQLEEADPECCLKIRDKLLTFVVAGGGFAGVETIAGMNDFMREAVSYYPNLKKDQIRMVLVHPGHVILPELGEKLGTYAQKKLSERKVEILVNTKVAGFSEKGVSLSDGSFIETNTLIWTAGTSPHPILNSLSCSKERGRLNVNEFLEVENLEGVWALGDCALIMDKKTAGYFPPTAQHAIREGKVAAKNILASIKGKEKTSFSFSTIGQLAAIGRRTGVANILGINFSGFIAWWLWRTIYLSKLPRFEKKLRVMFDWSLDLIFSKDLVQFETFRAPSVSHSEAEFADPGVKVGTGN
ncbi:MAG: NAD(P)/FAD-dependent oxidoreductase [Thermodesulfobacteriota bacterium]